MSTSGSEISSRHAVALAAFVIAFPLIAQVVAVWLTASLKATALAGVGCAILVFTWLSVVAVRSEGGIRNVRAPRIIWILRQCIIGFLQGFVLAAVIQAMAGWAP
jgi:hypothetical protein